MSTSDTKAVMITHTGDGHIIEGYIIRGQVIGVLNKDLWVVCVYKTKH